MTFAVGYVVGGTGAGRKKPLREKPQPWECECLDGASGRRLRPAYYSRCTDCGTERPKETAR